MVFRLQKYSVKNYFKRAIKLYKKDRLLSQIFMRIKSVYSLALSNQKKTWGCCSNLCEYKKVKKNYKMEI